MENNKTEKSNVINFLDAAKNLASFKNREHVIRIIRHHDKLNNENQKDVKKIINE